jgi:hypothetical protein
MLDSHEKCLDTQAGHRQYKRFRFLWRCIIIIIIIIIIIRKCLIIREKQSSVISNHQNFYHKLLP